MQAINQVLTPNEIHKDFITCCVLCLVALVLLDVVWLQGKYLGIAMHSIFARIR